MRLRARWWLGPLVALALAGGGVLSVSPAGAAEVGINVAATSGDLFNSAKVDAAIAASHPAWVRVFIGWDGIEPQQGVYNTAEIQNYQKFFAALPAGTKIDVDVEGTPPWAASGSTDIRTPPVDPADYAAFVELPCQRVRWPRHGVGDLERGGQLGLVERHPGAIRRAAQGRLSGDQVGGSQGHGAGRRSDRQRRRLSQPALCGRREGLLRRGRGAHRHRMQHHRPVRSSSSTLAPVRSTSTSSSGSPRFTR